jgi:hypothetical protein
MSGSRVRASSAVDKRSGCGPSCESHLISDRGLWRFTRMARLRRRQERDAHRVKEVARRAGVTARRRVPTGSSLTGAMHGLIRALPIDELEGRLRDLERKLAKLEASARRAAKAEKTPARKAPPRKAPPEPPSGRKPIPTPKPPPRKPPAKPKDPPVGGERATARA